MRVLIACKRGNIAPRNKTGHCLCDDCVAFRRERWRESNCARAAARQAWLAANPEKPKEYSARWRAANKEKRRAIEESWKKRNPDKVREYNARAGAKWSRKNNGARNAITIKRKAALLKRTPAWANMEAIRAFYEEAARLTRETGIPHEVDHIFPLQGETVSGLHVENNLQVISRRANRAKHNRMVSQ